MDEFLVRASLGGIGVALIAGPLGAFVVWRRMAYFGETLAHAALVGVTVSLLFSIQPVLGIALFCAAAAIILGFLQRPGRLAGKLPIDSLLGVIAQGALAIGLVLISFMDKVRVDLMSYLFGDVLAVTREDLIWIYAAAAIGLGAIALLWRSLLAITVHEELARVEGVATDRVRAIFLIVLALLIAGAVKIMGVLLVISLLIIPAAAARPLARSPEAMAAFAALIGAVAVIVGIAGSYAWDTPAGPSIVVAGLVAFVATRTVSWSRSARR